MASCNHVAPSESMYLPVHNRRRTSFLEHDQVGDRADGCIRMREAQRPLSDEAIRRTQTRCQFLHREERSDRSLDFVPRSLDLGLVQKPVVFERVEGYKIIT